MPRPARAKPLAPEDRRNAILDAVVPLIIEHGTEVTSREIAAAAGVAEGTIYRAFRDKEEIISAALRREFDTPAPGQAIADIPDGLGLQATLEAIVETMRNRTIRMLSLVAAAGPSRMRELQAALHPEDAPQDIPGTEPSGAHPARPSPGHRHGRQNPRGHHPMQEQAIAQIAQLLAPYAAELRMPPPEAARLARLTVLAMSHPMMTGGETYESPAIVDYLVHGLARDPAAVRAPESPTTPTSPHAQPPRTRDVT